MSNNTFSSNPPDIPSISSLHHEKHTKETSKNDIFNIVLNKIVQKIVYTNRHTEQTYVLFEIPQILIGYPQYDMKSCLLFVMNRLSSSGYFIEFIDPFYVYIDWGKSSISWHQRKLDKQIFCLRPRGFIKSMPRWNRIRLEFQELKALTQNNLANSEWENYLSNHFFLL